MPEGGLLMARLNVRKPQNLFTHEGGRAKAISPELMLRRSVLACLLWEKQFYEDGVDIASRVQQLVPLVQAQHVADLAIEAREAMKLRHMPLFLVREMARVPYHRKLVAATLERVIQRADEPGEFLAIYWMDGKKPLSSQVKKGLARAFKKFDAYQLAKYDRASVVKLRDVMFMVHPKPGDDEQEATWKKLVDGTLESPDTWEVALSRGDDKRESWDRLLREKKLGALALLRNLRNMATAHVDESLVLEALKNMHTERILPFRFVAAARHAPQWESQIEQAMYRSLEGIEKLTGKTVLLVDVSGSMDAMLSGKSQLVRMDAACGLAVLAREICEDVEIYSFSNEVRLIPNRRGFALRDAIVGSQPHGGTYLGKALTQVMEECKFDRLIVFTDEQSHDRVPDPRGLGYMINVASYQNGVGYGPWMHIDGWSEAVLKYIPQLEMLDESVQ